LTEEAGVAGAAVAETRGATAAERTGPIWFDLGDLRSAIEPLASAVPAPAPTVASAAVAPAAVPAPTAAPAPDPIAVAVALLMDGYAWDERSPRVTALQQQLGVTADGWYANATLRAHRAALQAAGLPIDHLPVAPVPAGPSAAQWAALRRCESNGDYSITNPSGRYRGAYQFDRSTWNSVASRHAPQLVGVDPAAAAPADQDAMAFALYGERGWRPWPHCGRHLR
jgi:hypothetical protein